MKHSRNHHVEILEPQTLVVWPTDSLDEVDDEAFARAIAEGRAAEQRELALA